MGDRTEQDFRQILNSTDVHVCIVSEDQMRVKKSPLEFSRGYAVSKRFPLR